MATIDYKQKIKDYMNSSEVDTLYKSMLNNLFPELKDSEDEKIRKEILSFLKEGKPYHCPNSAKRQKWSVWLEKQGEKKLTAWSEEDEKMFELALNMIEWYSVVDKDKSRSVSDWLKSLKGRYTWKPSDEQMKILNEVLNFAANHESSHWNDYIFGTLNNLIRQLKKLKG